MSALAFFEEVKKVTSREFLFGTRNLLLLVREGTLTMLVINLFILSAMQVLFFSSPLSELFNLILYDGGNQLSH